MIDADHLSAENLGTSAVFRDWNREHPGSLHQSKAELVCAMAEASGRSGWESRVVEIGEMGWAELHRCDGLVCCTDNTLSRVEAALISQRLQIPMLDTGLRSQGSEARVSWFPGRPECACFACGLTETRRAEVLTFAASASLGCSFLAAADSLSAGQPEADAAAWVSQRALAQLVSAFTREHLGMVDDSTSQGWTERRSGARMIRTTHGEANQSCPFHHPVAAPDERWVAVEENRSLGEQIPGPDWELVLPWPVARVSRCSHCDTLDRRSLRLARLRRASCTRCGVASGLEPLEVVHRTLPGSPESHCTPSEVGLPPKHLLVARRRLKAEYRVSKDEQGVVA